MADDKKPAVKVEDVLDKETIEKLDEAFERGTLEVGAEPVSFDQCFTPENVEGFLRGKVTWAQLMGITMDDAYKLAEMGYSFYEQARYHDAKTVFEGLIIANPYDSYFHNMLGATYQQLDMKEEALQQYSDAIELDPEAPHPYINRGEMHLQEGHFQAAVADLKRATELDPSSQDPAMVRARALVSATTGVIEGLQKFFGDRLPKSDKPAAKPKK